MGSPFASKYTDTIPLPLDAPHTITIRKLTGKEVAEAQEAHASGLNSGQARFWSLRFRRILESGQPDADVLKALADPLTGFERFTMIRAGLLAWTYPESITPVPANAAAKTPAIDAVADLDDEAVDFIATEILRLTKPGLFLTLEAAEVERKNGSGGSIAG